MRAASARVRLDLACRESDSISSRTPTIILTLIGSSFRVSYSQFSPIHQDVRRAEVSNNLGSSVLTSSYERAVPSFMLNVLTTSSERCPLCIEKCSNLFI